MLENVDCVPMSHWLFFTTTILFMFFSFILTRRIVKLRKKVFDLINLVSLKEKELKEKTMDPRRFLVPYDTEKSKSIVISVNAKHKITYVNDYAEEFFGFSKEELLNQDLFKTIYQKNNPSDTLEENIVDRILTNPRIYVEHESENIKKNGEKIWVSWTNRVVYNDKGEPVEIRSVGFDISKRKNLETELRSLSAVDPATGVLSRQAFLTAGVHELKRANRYNRQLSLLIIDLNCFHVVNETQELKFTDEILHNTIELCRKSVRDSDIIGRIGDIEFGILLPETAPENAIFLAERLKQKIQEKNLEGEIEFFVTMDFGVSGKEEKEETIDSLMQKALNTLHQSEKNARLPHRRKQKGE